MAQNDYGNPSSPFSGTQLNNRIRDWRDALHTLHSGSVRPSYAVAGMLWLRIVSSSEWQLMLFDGTDDILCGTINPIANTFTPSGLSGYAQLAGATFTGAVSVPNATAGGHALNRQTADGRYARLDAVNVFTASQRVTANLRVARADTNTLGGRLVSCRALDDADGYFWQTFGAGENPSFRAVRGFGGVTTVFTIGPDGTVTTAGPVTLPGAPTAANHAATKAYVDAVVSQVLIVEDQKPAGTNGGTSTAGSWQTRVLNTVVHNGISGASLSSNQVTLPAGTYDVRAVAVADRPLSHRIRIWNATSSATLVLGLSQFDRIPYSDNGDVGVAQLDGRFTLASTAAVVLQHYVNQGRVDTGWGRPVNFDSQPEVYASVRFTKVA